MSISCSWEKPLGFCFSKYDEKKEHPITIWGGGNCIAVFTRGKQRCLENFIADEKHFKACEYQGDEYVDIIISYARKKEAQKLIKLLASACFCFETTTDTIMRIEE